MMLFKKYHDELYKRNKRAARFVEKVLCDVKEERGWTWQIQIEGIAHLTSARFYRETGCGRKTVFFIAEWLKDEGAISSIYGWMHPYSYIPYTDRIPHDLDQIAPRTLHAFDRRSIIQVRKILKEIIK